MDTNKDDKQIVLNEQSLEVLVAKFIPTSQYFERSFELLRDQIKEQNQQLENFRVYVDKRFEYLENTILDFKQDVDRRFQEVDRKFKEVDKRFEQVDKRFEQIDKRFEQVDKKIEQLTQNIHQLTLEVKELGKKQEVTLREYIIERDRYYDKKFTRHRAYFLTIIGLVLTIFLKMVGIVNIPTINGNINKTEIHK
jgi:prefoldin subunit 5